MRKVSAVFLLALMLCLTGCLSGPKQMARSVDDWDNSLYVQSPWMNTVLWYTGVFPLLGFGAGLGDTLVLNPLAFWGDDGWICDGTAFRHARIAPKDHTVESFVSDREVAKR